MALKDLLALVDDKLKDIFHKSVYDPSKESIGADKAHRGDEEKVSRNRTGERPQGFLCGKQRCRVSSDRRG